MINLIYKILLCSLSLLWVLGCAGAKHQPPPYTYYHLEYETENHGLQENRIDAVLKVERFCLSPSYGSNKIMYRSGDVVTRFYPYKEWASSPEKLVADRLFRDLKKAGLFKAVFGPDDINRATYSLFGCVHDFYELDADDAWYAVLTVSISLLDEQGTRPEKRVLFQKTYEQQLKSLHKTPVSMAHAMSKAMSIVSRSAISDIAGHIKKKKEGLK